jgi:hypothetical protein
MALIKDELLNEIEELKKNDKTKRPANAISER